MVSIDLDIYHTEFESILLTHQCVPYLQVYFIFDFKLDFM